MRTTQNSSPMGNSLGNFNPSHRSTGRGIIKDTESKRALVSSAKNNKFVNNYFHESGVFRGVTPTAPSRN
jgi:hypothetical protein